MAGFKADPFEALRGLLPGLAADVPPKLERYAALLEEYNRRVNLVSRADVENLWENHLFPSLAVLALVRLQYGAAVADIGSGGGLPGIPLKLARPDLELVLIDSIRKKTLFHKKVVQDLRLGKVAAVNTRLLPGEAPPFLRRQFDVVTARAVGSVEVLVPLVRPLLKDGGVFLAWKGESDIPDLRNGSAVYNYKYEVLVLRESQRDLSRRLDSLRIFKIRFS